MKLLKRARKFFKHIAKRFKKMFHRNKKHDD